MTRMYVPLFVFVYVLGLGVVAAHPIETAWAIGVACIIKIIKLAW